MESDLSQLSALPRDRRRAAVFAVLLVLLNLVVLPNAQRSWGASLQLFGIVITLSFGAVLVTGMLLWAQSRISLNYAAPTLAVAYTMTATCMVPYLLFYRNFWPAAGMRASADPQTAAWLWVEWHLTFVLGAVGYQLLKRFGLPAESPETFRRGRHRIAWGGFAIVAVTVPLLISTDGLPELFVTSGVVTPLSLVLTVVIMLLGALAVVLGYAYGRFHSALDVWLAAACLSFVFDVGTSLYTHRPFSAGWYVSRIDILLGSTIVFGVLLFHAGRLSSALATTARRYEDESRHDALTEIANRRAFDEEMVRMLGRARRENRPVALALIDVDHFKDVNDKFGHQTGDSCLISIARELKRVVGRHGDVVARFGGDEFALLLENSTPAGALTVAHRARTMVRALRMPAPSGGAITLSVGVAMSREDDEPANLLQRADAALYRAKAHGRNAVAAEEIEGVPAAP